ncbi:oligopeptidase B [Rhodothalassium salexigens DSM 2132]|uniref:Oligopeptidase B n=1 Tax=Rhodothalassium salexigens DSM 2132 TaxID=1188247 RepID=A0A4R2PLC6_RHOSA|nr:S9 family peptidase [Rhodothalassium salexigens]MBB4210942.1 oligopeptidase B [Rhodothalassium salexigens DSM 2132]MBK1639808.1 S9 family peptidase [Rhodothalassium salexigens DSM 2132]TCP36400.1 oligopeptidase B [Rhodothalassium salexigens DSM 2132]
MAQTTRLPAPADPQPPQAARRPHRTTHHGQTLEDDYAWLKDPAYPEVTDPDVLAYLEAENRYFEAVMAPHAPLVETLYEEMKGRLKEDDAAVPWRDGAWMYQWRFEVGAQYLRWYRWPADGDAGDAQCILDEVALSEGNAFFRLGALAVSPDGRRAAYACDFNGDERFTVQVRDLDTDTLHDLTIEGTVGRLVWDAAGDGFFYVEVTENWRPYRVRYHRLGDDPAADRTVYEEKDGAFFVGIDRTRSRRFLVITAGDHVTQEARVLRLDAPDGEPVLVAPRRRGHEYYVDHGEGRFFIRTNDRDADFRIVAAPEDHPQEVHWRELVPAEPGLYITGHAVFKRFLVLEERVDGLDQIRIRFHGEDGESHRIAFDEEAYAAELGRNAEYDVDTIRFVYESMVTPDSIVDYSVDTRTRQVRKVRAIPSGYDPALYETRRLHARARDGAMVPVSLVYRKDRYNADAPRLHLTGYGAYGLGTPPFFSPARLSLLDRGFAVAIAHIRGGDELGRAWYLAGKLNRRTNTFNDFEDAARALIKAGWARDGRISISGGSAGGTLIGAAVNQAPDLWRAAVLHVPFVDVLNTMLDAELPLTPIEWPEWGNPIDDARAFATIRAYSPYDQIRAQAYPPMLVTAGISDPRVTYWEPAKWTAKLRALKADDNAVLLKTNMDAGHGGKSGRYERLRESAEEYAFILTAFAPEASG